tara:strand:+ start:200 stop:643 length:444 start_codon:yes stop_codon:yes gene_type:complete
MKIKEMIQHLQQQILWYILLKAEEQEIAVDTPTVMLVQYIKTLLGVRLEVVPEAQMMVLCLGQLRHKEINQVLLGLMGLVLMVAVVEIPWAAGMEEAVAEVLEVLEELLTPLFLGLVELVNQTIFVLVQMFIMLEVVEVALTLPVRM